MAESEKKLRRLAEIQFTRKREEFCEYCGKEKRSDCVIAAKFEELTDSWRNLELRHDSYLAHVEDSNVASEEKWIREARCMYDEAMEKHGDLRRVGTSTTNERIMIDLEKTKLPKFSGNIRDYPRFKSDFRKYIEPNLPLSIVSYTLRTCLSRAHRIRNTDDIKEMWTILDDKYADSAMLADVILDEIRRTRKFDDDETTRFIDFVDKAEDGYHDLCTLGLQREITTTSSVSEIEQKLSPEMSTRWARQVVSDPAFDKSNKLPSLLVFLRSEKGTMEYRLAGLRCNHVERIEGTAQHINVSAVREIHAEITENDRTSTVSNTCLIHRSSNHKTCDCEKYNCKTVEQRFELMRQKGECWSCLVVGHRFKDCTRKRVCGQGGCRRRHHRSLHVDNTQKDDLRVNHVTAFAREICDIREVKELHEPGYRTFQDKTEDNCNRTKKLQGQYAKNDSHIEQDNQKQERNRDRIDKLYGVSRVRDGFIRPVPERYGYVNPDTSRNMITYRSNTPTPFYNPLCCNDGYTQILPR